MEHKQYAWSVRLSAMAGIALMVLAAFFAVPDAAKADEINVHEECAVTEVQPRAIITDVVDTYWNYTCPNKVSGHNIYMFNVSYRRLTFQKGYTRKAHRIGGSASIMCSCGKLGILDQWKFTYDTY